MWTTHCDLGTSASRSINHDMFITIVDDVKIVSKGILFLILPLFVELLFMWTFLVVFFFLVCSIWIESKIPNFKIDECFKDSVHPILARFGS